MADNNSMKLQEGVQTSQAEIRSEGQIKRTTAAATALLALTLYAGNPAPAKAETPTASNNTAAFVINADYEKIIAEAKKQGKDPVEYAKAKKESGEWTMRDYIGFSKYNRQIQDQAAIEDGLRIAGKKQADIEVKTKIDSVTEQINTKTMSNLRTIAGIYNNDADIFSKKPEWRTYVFEVYNNQQGHYKPETVQYVIVTFPKIIQNGTTIAMNIK